MIFCSLSGSAKLYLSKILFENKNETTTTTTTTTTTNAEMSDEFSKRSIKRRYLWRSHLLIENLGFYSTFIERLFIWNDEHRVTYVERPRWIYQLEFGREKKIASRCKFIHAHTILIQKLKYQMQLYRFEIIIPFARYKIIHTILTKILVYLEFQLKTTHANVIFFKKRIRYVHQLNSWTELNWTDRQLSKTHTKKNNVKLKTLNDCWRNGGEKEKNNTIGI